MTYDEKVALYRAGRYRFKAPPVCCTQWGERDWINWVSACNGWLP